MSSRRRSPQRAAPRTFEHRNLPLLLLQAREAVLARFRPILNEQGVTEQQWRVLRALVEQGALEQRQVGALCRISSPSLAGVLARMDELGLVRRERLAEDQRRVMVSLTANSRALAQQMAPRIEATYRALEVQLGADFVAQAYATLDELLARLGGATPESDA
jgi:homoprotocatechuate degradation regulator HpaR